MRHKNPSDVPAMNSLYKNKGMRNDGIALVIVLAVLVLVTALVIGFLVRTGSERAAAANYRATARTRQLADLVVNLVQAQINQATSPASLNGTSAWASQPGAIRVFNTTGNQISQMIYRLYSANSLTANSYSALSYDLPSSSYWPQWLSSPSVWVDLNAPVPFAISGTNGYQAAYPILDPRNPTSGGGDFTNGQTFTGFQINPGLIGLSGSTSIAPMPVQWLYVLQDGTIVPPNMGNSLTTGSNVILTGTAASSTNPIVGRIAFWTDDDSCRVNVNTAGDGTFWDTPRYTAPDEWILGYYSPATYEFQRYPGHPATTSLLPVLNAVTGGASSTLFPSNPSTGNYKITLPTSGGYFSYSGNNPYTTTAYQNLFTLTPRYAYGGSEEATAPYGVSYNFSNGLATSSPAPLNSQRLYPSVGEILYSSTGTGTARTLNGGTTPLLTRQQLETAKFFLTAHSRAPELNLFGTPRVSIWPLTIGSSLLAGTSLSLSGSQVVPAGVRNTATDQLLAFASTISGNSSVGASGTSVYPFYFMRNSNIDPWTDFNITVNGAYQNQQILAYLDNLTSLPVPGFSASNSSFDNKYGQTGMRQILTEIYDYVRTTDTEDGTVIANNNGSLGNIFGQNWNNGNAGIGHVVPNFNTMWLSSTGTLEGFGTFARPTCVTIHLVGLGNGLLYNLSGVLSGTSLNIPANQIGYSGFSNYDHANITSQGVVANGRVALQAFIYVQFVIPGSARIDSNSPVFEIQMNGLNTLTLTNGTSAALTNGTSAALGFPTTSGTMAYQMNLGGGLGSYGNDQFTGQLPIFGELKAGAGGYDGRASGTGLYNFAFYSQIITLPYVYGANNTIILTGGTNVVMNLMDSSTSSNVIQTVNLNFNAAGQKGPLPFPVSATGTPGTAGTGAGSFLSNARLIGTAALGDTGNINDTVLDDRWQGDGSLYFDPIHDVTASLVLNSPWDDPRMLAIENVPATAFTAHQNWGKQMAHDLTFNPDWVPFPGNSASGKLVAGATYGSAYPCVRTSDSNGVSYSGGHVNGSFYGDWDNGAAWSSDGPWVNRADEGGAPNTVTYAGWAYLPYFTAGNGNGILGPGTFSPNREVPSPATFGSLPTGVDPTGANPKPWQTLLFRPGALISHPGRGQPTEGQPPYTVVPDHLLLDLFWMPASEPYAISEPFSTAGKVNLNYQILPFGLVSTGSGNPSTSGTVPYMRRDTGIRSALSSLKIAGVPLLSASTYKTLTGGNWWGQWGNVNNFFGDNGGNTARLPIDVNQTLQQFDSTFDNGQIFQSASEICDLYLVPLGYNLSTFSSSTPGAGSWYGSDFAMVGDNVRERPYADIYSRITTKSNTYTVYFTVQELKNSPTSPPGQWNESAGTVVGEYRGSVDLERYIQQSATLPNYLANPTISGTTSLEPYYRWRVLENNQFAP